MGRRVGGARRATAREKEMRALLAERRRSGLSLSEFSRRRGIPLGTLAWWTYAIRQRDRARSGERGEAETFVPVRVVSGAGETAGPAERFEVRLGGGRGIRLPSSFDPEALARLVAVLEGLPC